MTRFRSALGKRRKRAALAAVAAVALATMTACSSTTEPGDSGSPGAGDPGTGGADTYKVGVALAFSGINASYGNAFKQAIDLAAENINDSGLLTKKIEVLYEDDAADAQQGVAAITKLIKVDQVVFNLVGFSNVIPALQPIAERSKVPMVNGGAISPSLANQPYLYNVIPFMDTEVAAQLPYLKETMPDARKIVLITSNDETGEHATKILKELWDGDGRSSTTIAMPLGATSFTSQVQKTVSENPDIVYIIYSGTPQATLIQQLRNSGVTAQIVGGSPFSVDAVMSLPEADGAVFSSESVDFDEGSDATQTFVKSFADTYDATPTFYQVNYYNGMLMFAKAVKQLEDEGTAVTGDALNSVFESYVGQTLDVVGGSMILLDDHTVSTPIAIHKIENGKPTLLTIIKPDAQ